MKKILLIPVIILFIILVGYLLVFSNPSKFECIKTGGNWRTLSGCGDSCDAQRNPGQIICAAYEYDGCDCGPDKCWNGKTCEPN